MHSLAKQTGTTALNSTGNNVGIRHVISKQIIPNGES
jgi:hypothetical protein